MRSRSGKTRSLEIDQDRSKAAESSAAPQSNIEAGGGSEGSDSIQTRAAAGAHNSIQRHSNILKRAHSFAKDHSRMGTDLSLLLLSGLSVTLDPLFFLIPVVDDGAACVGWDKNLRTVTLVLRTVVDLLQLAVLLRGRIFGADDESRKRQSQPDLEGPRQRYRHIKDTIVAIAAILPLPQIAILAGASIMSSMMSLKVMMVSQFIPRVYHIILCYEEASRSTEMLFFYAWLATVYNLGMYFLAANALGGLWYLQAVQREIDCWNKAWEELEKPCRTNFTLNCDENNGAQRNTILLVRDCCPIPPPSNTTMNYGIYIEAFESKAIRRNTPFIQRWMHCFWWAVRNLTSFGGNLETVNYEWDIVLAIFIAICGLVLFALLIGNMQKYLLLGRENRMRKRKNLEEWEPFKRLSYRLKREVAWCESFRWQGPTEVNLETLLHNLPRFLKEKIKPELCKQLLSKVPEFASLNKSPCEALCELAKPVVFPERSYIHQEGELITEMVLVLHGDLLSYTKRDKEEGNSPGRLSKDNFFGEELIQHWLPLQEGTTGLPTAQRTIKTLTKVEAFVITEFDLKNVFDKHRGSLYRDQQLVRIVPD